MFKQYLNTPYDVNEQGECYSHLSKKKLTPQLSSRYPTYNLTIDGKKKKVKIHRMVAETFLPREEGKDIVNHKDGNTHNYCVDNLEWCTAQENNLHAIQTGLRPPTNQTIIRYVGDLENELWKPVKDYPNYMISSYGRVMNIRTKRLLKIAISNYGYPQVSLWKNNKGKTTQVHQLVYSHFANDFDLLGYVINHKDGDKTNNNFDNLEKVTYQENNLHATYVIKTNKSAKGVQQVDMEGNIIAEFPSIAEAQRTLNIKNISRAARNGLTAGGFYWYFINN